jgi:hypothetical protein
LGLGTLNLLLAHLDASQAARGRTLHDEARELVPARARIVAERESDCVEFRSSPSCVTIVFDWSGSYEARLATAEELLRERGWRPAPDRPSFVYQRRDLEAGVHGEWWNQVCAGKPPVALDWYDRDRCLDGVSVRVT